MSKPARGTKRVCASCGARFYDLSRSPITCPVCQALYQISPPSPSRRSSERTERTEQAAPAKPVEKKTEAPVAGGAEVISLDEAEKAEEAAVGDEEIAAIGGDDEDIPDSDNEDDTFLEADEEEDTDVSGIVKGDRNEDS